MSLFDSWKEEEARKKKYEALIEGCHKHPAYRYKRKPQTGRTGKPCARCAELYGFYMQLKAWDEEVNGWWKSWHEVESRRQREESRAREDMLNCPG